MPPSNPRHYQEERSLTPHFPEYRLARHFLRILDGVPYILYREMHKQIAEQRGTPQSQVDWSSPDEWIPERLYGDEQSLAQRVWQESGHELNPRYLTGCWRLVTRHDLMEEDGQGVLRITERGRHFLEQLEGDTVAEIDAYEGVLTVLRLVAERGPGQRGDFLPEYTEFCHTFTRYRSDSVVKGSLYDRLVNLVGRKYVVRQGATYEITEDGLSYLERYAQLVPGQTTEAGSQRSELRRLARDLSAQARTRLHEYLLRMDPFKFEHLIKFLLEEMGYTDVEVTSPVNDKGVDVVADLELGVSQVREVIQVKRHRGNISRRTLDQLRGSLHRFDAVRGTIITTGGFSRGSVDAAFERGAAPITLIDGDKLINLLIEHELGVRKRATEYLEFDNSELAQFEPTEEDEEVEL